MSKRRRGGMRPYMLWLTRVYGRSITGYAVAFQTWPNVLDDWLRRCAEDRFRRESHPRLEPSPRSLELIRAHRRRIANGSPRLAGWSYAAPESPRAAGQGER